MGELTLPVVVAAALVDGLNPCAFAVLLAFVGAVLLLLERSSARGARWMLWRTGSAFILGVFAAYLALGLTGLSVLRSLAAGHRVGRGAGLVAVALGLLTLQEALVPEWGLRLHAPAALAQRVRTVATRGSLPAVGLGGALVGLCTVPCSGAVYLAVLGLLASWSSSLQGLAYLVLYNAVFVLPLVALLAAASSRPVFQTVARWQLHHRQSLKFGLGSVAVAVGLLLLASL